MANKLSYTKEQFVEAIKNSYSISQVLKKLNLSATGGNYKSFKLRSKKLGIDFSHFTGQAHLKGKKHNWTKSIPLEKILVKNSEYLWNNPLKKRLIKKGILKYKCYNCELEEWLGKPISLQLEHKNGDNTDNRLENLTLLCPNCHSQTATFAGKNKRTIKKQRYCKKCKTKITKQSKSGLCVKCVKKQLYCIDCNTKINKRSKRCVECSILTIRKVKDRPSKEQLLLEIEETNYCVVGRKYGVSDNAVRKWLK